MDLQIFVLVVPISCDCQRDATCSDSEASRGCRQRSSRDGETLQYNAAVIKPQKTLLELTIHPTTGLVLDCTVYTRRLLHYTLITAALSLCHKQGNRHDVCGMRHSHSMKCMANCVLLHIHLGSHLERLYSMCPMGRCASPLTSGMLRFFSSASKMGKPTLRTVERM